jgi:hypothetical protein
LPTTVAPSVTPSSSSNRREKKVVVNACRLYKDCDGAKVLIAIDFSDAYLLHTQQAFTPESQGEEAFPIPIHYFPLDQRKKIFLRRELQQIPPRLLEAKGYHIAIGLVNHTEEVVTNSEILQNMFDTIIDRFNGTSIPQGSIDYIINFACTKGLLLSFLSYSHICLCLCLSVFLFVALIDIAPGDHRYAHALLVLKDELKPKATAKTNADESIRILNDDDEM